MLHSIYDLTTFCRKTTGDVPAKLVVCSLISNICTRIHHFCSQGASTTVIGSKMYLFVSISSPFSVLDYKPYLWIGREAGNGTKDGVGPLCV